MMAELLTAAFITIPCLLSGWGAGSLYAWFKGQDTRQNRGKAMLIGLLTGIIIFNTQIWLAYNGRDLNLIPVVGTKTP